MNLKFIVAGGVLIAAGVVATLILGKSTTTASDLFNEYDARAATGGADYFQYVFHAVSRITAPNQPPEMLGVVASVVSRDGSAEDKADFLAYIAMVRGCATAETLDLARVAGYPGRYSDALKGLPPCKGLKAEEQLGWLRFLKADTLAFKPLPGVSATTPAQKAGSE